MDEIVSCLRLSTQDLRLEHFQGILSFSQNIGKNSDDAVQQFVVTSSELLWKHLHSTLHTMECQLICATSFFAILTHHENPELYLEDLERKISNYQKFSIHNNMVNRKETFVTISLIYGMYQSCYINSLQNNNLMREIIKKSFEVIILSTYDYSEFTFVIFKTVQSFHKLLNTSYKDILLDGDQSIKLLQITIHNWENPITGIRDLNKNIFGLYLDLSTQTDKTRFHYEKLMKEINNFPWNKAKYLMLSEIIATESKNVTFLFKNNPDWINGLIKSLATSSLVSAGADMYFSVLKKINSDNEWCHIFLNSIKNVLNGSDFKTLQNFNNYWCMNTLKLFPEIFNPLTKLLQNLENEDCMYAYLSLLRQGNRLGLLSRHWTKRNVEEINHQTENGDDTITTKIKEGLEHININIRIQTFEIVCISHNNAYPTNVEFDLVMEFLDQNINSDSTVLRLSLLNNIRLFFNRLIISTLNILKRNTPMEEDVEVLKRFCVTLQRYLKDQLLMKGNYQRSITTIKLCDTLLSTFSNSIQRKRKQIKSTEKECTLKCWLTENNLWYMNEDEFIEILITYLDDPADDVRETAREILVKNYTAFVSSPNIIQNLLDTSLNNLKSKFFYETSSGHCGLNVVIHILTTKKYNSLKFNSIEELFDYFYFQFKNDIDNKIDIVTSIETGKPLHSLMKVLQNILEVCLKMSYPIDKILPNDSIRVLVMKLKEIPLFYTTEDSNTCSPDFAEMSVMVENLIKQSSLKIQQDTEVKISDVHQIVLNCVWLNLKACCDLLAVLVKCTDQMKDLDKCEECLNTIANVLEMSRHKGAIEAAGMALGKSVKHLTAESKNSSARAITMSLLTNKLDELILHNEQRSITRRGAGLPIMLHRIVSNDSQKEKPLFHYAINRLLEVSSFENSEIRAEKENERDIPQAIYIHLMTKMVADSSLASEVMFYSARLAEVAFTHLTSDQWQIRNAALQLYGALVSKLIGQKKSSSDKEETSATVAYDELRTHSPKLWTYIQQKLNTHDCKDSIQAHSNLVPILNLLASTAKKYNFSFDSVKHHEEDKRIFINLMRLLGSPIHTVRRLSAKSIELMYNFDMIFDFIQKIDNVSENFLHGILMLVENCEKRLGQNDRMSKIQKILKDLIEYKTHSFVVKSIYEKVFWNETNLIHKIQSTLDVLKISKNTAGAFIWSNTIIKNCIRNCKDGDLPIILNYILNTEDFAVFCDDIIMRIKSEHVSKEILKQTASVLLEYEQKFYKNGIWKILYEISLRTNITMECNNVIEIIDYFNFHKWNLTYKNRFLMPFIAHCIDNFSHDEKFMYRFSEYLLLLTNFELVDTDMRYIAAITNNALGNIISNFTYKIKENVIRAALNMLQDDDEDIRFESAKFYSNTLNIKFVYQPFICLRKILSYEYLYSILGEHLKQFVDKLNESIVNENKTTEKGYNPFILETRNIYVEPKIFAFYVNKLENYS